MKPTGVIITSGSSSAGKSFLANAIKTRYPDTGVVHCTYRYKDAMWQYHLAAVIRACRYSQERLFIIDRNWPSEEIYAHVYRGGTKWPHEGRILQKLLLKHAAVTIYCHQTVEQALERIAQERQEYHSPKFLTKTEEVVQRYIALWGGRSVEERKTYADDIMDAGGLQCRIDAMIYRRDVEGTDLGQFIDNVTDKLEFLRGVQYQPALDFQLRNVAGNLYTATHLLVGDQVNHANYKKCWPFMAYANSSLWLAEVMHRLKLKEEKFVWTNACCPEEHLVALIESKPSLKVIAFGAQAAVRCKLAGIQYTSLPHPSYARRFLSNSGRWALQLKAATL